MTHVTQSSEVDEKLHILEHHTEVLFSSQNSGKAREVSWQHYRMGVNVGGQLVSF